MQARRRRRCRRHHRCRCRRHRRRSCHRCRRHGRHNHRGWHLLIRRVRAEIAVIGAAGCAAQRRSIRLGVASGIRRVLVRGMLLVVPAADPQLLMVVVMIVVMVMVMMMLMLTRRYRRGRPVLVHLVIWLLYPGSSR